MDLAARLCSIVPMRESWATDGTLYVTDVGTHTVRAVRPDGLVYTVAGLGTAGFADGDENQAMFNAPSGITVDLDGSLIVADSLNHRIRRINLDPSGPPPITPRVALQTNPSLMVYGVPGKMYRIDCSENPEKTEWVALDTIMLGQKAERWFDPRPTNPNRIYRAVEVLP
jgi:hypothetical protein